ncbi:hypothetical protein ACEN2S_22905, partial [Phaeovulum sp. W22_SRMD_FR3]
KNHIQKGEVITVATPAGWINFGEGMIIGNLFNVPGTCRFLVGVAGGAAGNGITSGAVRLDSMGTVAA